jgi:hypothetical protein
MYRTMAWYLHGYGYATFFSEITPCEGVHMNTKQFISLSGAVLLGLSSLSVQAVPSGLFDYGFNIDGSLTLPGDPIPAAINLSGFDLVSGLGDITATITGAGAHSFDAFFDHEIDEAINTFFNEFGAVTGVAAAGQSWEIDEPGYDFPPGDIFDNFVASTLDNSNAVPSGAENDVSMAMGWDFTLAADETALIELVLTDILPTGGFFLTHTDPDSQYSVYLSSSLTIRGGVPTPEPSILLLLGIGLTGLLLSRRRMHQA